MTSAEVFVHESSYVDEPSSIGAGTKIWHFSHVMKNARIGAACNIGQNVVISPDVVIGNNVKIQNNVSIYTGCILEDDVFCGPSMVFTNVINPRSHVARKDEYQTTLVRQGASLGANSTVVCGTTMAATRLSAPARSSPETCPTTPSSTVTPRGCRDGAARAAWRCRSPRTRPKPPATPAARRTRSPATASPRADRTQARPHSGGTVQPIFPIPNRCVSAQLSGLAPSS